MTRNNKQCKNSNFFEKFADRNYNYYVKKYGDSPDSTSSKEWERYWDKYYKWREKQLLAYAKTNGIPVCENRDGLVRLYIRKMTYIQDGLKKYQKLEPFGWFCKSCKNIEIDPSITNMKFPFHSTWTTDDLDHMRKTRTN